MNVRKLTVTIFSSLPEFNVRITKDSPRYKDELDTMKFVCKDFWMSMYKKQIDNLRTNHQGVYVLQDNRFKMLTQLSNSKQYLEAAPRVSTSVTVNSTWRQHPG